MEGDERTIFLTSEQMQKHLEELVQWGENTKLPITACLAIVTVFQKKMQQLVGARVVLQEFEPDPNLN